MGILTDDVEEFYEIMEFHYVYFRGIRSEKAYRHVVKSKLSVSEI